MSLAAELVALLRERRLTIGVAESLTGGELAGAIVSVPGASQVLRGGIVAYMTPIKQSLLGVDAALLAEHGAVHADVARQMASGIREALTIDGHHADIGIATTGVAGPEPQDGQPVGTVYIGVQTPAGGAVRRCFFEGDRAAIRAQATEAALAVVLAALRGE